MKPQGKRDGEIKEGQHSCVFLQGNPRDRGIKVMTKWAELGSISCLKGFISIKGKQNLIGHKGNKDIFGKLRIKYMNLFILNFIAERWSKSLKLTPI